jgi:hypothetical protein
MALGVLTFKADAYLAEFERQKHRFSECYPMSVLERFFAFSVIGFYRSGGKGYGGAEFVFRYKEPRGSFDPNSPQFKLHPGLMDVLGLRKFSGANP